MAETLSMIFELKRVAFRNLARHKVKTILTCLAIMVSVCLYIFMDGWLSGMSIESRRNIVNYESGAAKLQTKLYFEKKDELPSYENFTGWEVFATALDKAGYNSAPRFVFSGTLYSPSGTAPILFNAVDPLAEQRVLGYAKDQYIESGRYIRRGAFEMVIGALAADKLKVGIPQRPLRQELEGSIAGSAQTPADRDFILSLYEPVKDSGGLFAPVEESDVGNERMSLKKKTSAVDRERYWNILAESGRNDVRISTVIDIKAAPQTIRKDKWEVDLYPLLSAGEQRLMNAAYEWEAFLETYVLVEEDERALDAVLNAMVRVDFSGAVSHVSQLVNAVVVGVISSPDPATNGNIAYLPLDVLQDEAGMMLEGHVTELLIRAKGVKEAALPGKNESATAIGAALGGLPSELGVFSWDEYVKDYLGYEALESNSSMIFVLLLFLLSFLGISNTMLMAIMERTKEIGMMRAQGMTDGQMIITYMLEAGFLGFIGSALGIIAGCLITIPMVEQGMDFSAMMDAMGGSLGYRVSSNFRSTWNVPVIIGAGIVATLLSSLMAFFPTRRAVKMPITESLRFE
jgi:ABC-type lipoprotein release transport system permease subunit